MQRKVSGQAPSPGTLKAFLLAAPRAGQAHSRLQLTCMLVGKGHRHIRERVGRDKQDVELHFAK